MSAVGNQRRKHLWIGGLLIAAGLIPVGLVSYSAWNWYRARSWKPATAKIESARLQSKANSDPRGTSTCHTLVVEYEYTWKDSTYHGDGVSPFNRIEFSTQHRRDLASELRRGEEVTCFVNPDDPHDAYLYRDFRPLTFTILSLVAVLFIGSGILVVRQQLRRT